MLELSTLLAGFGLGLSLLVAIGAQNAFVLRHGLMRHHVGIVVAICAVSDAVLIAAGIVGVGELVTAHPSLMRTIRLGGALFVFAYAAFAIRRMFRPAAMRDNASERSSLAAVVATTFAVTWLNPYVYLDTMVLLGSVANSHDARFSFGVGACAASVLWFVSLGYASRWLRPLFAKPSAWRVLDAVIAATMLLVGARLITGTA